MNNILDNLNEKGSMDGYSDIDCKTFGLRLRKEKDIPKFMIKTLTHIIENYELVEEKYAANERQKILKIKVKKHCIPFESEGLKYKIILVSSMKNYNNEMLFIFMNDGKDGWDNMSIRMNKLLH